MCLFKKYKCKYEMIHDNLNGQWLMVDLSNKKYKFYFKLNQIQKEKKKIKQLSF